MLPCARSLTRLLATARPQDLGLRAVHAAAQSGLERQFAADRRALLDYFPTAIEEMKSAASVVDLPSEAERLGRVLTHTLPNGRLFRGCQALHACRELLPSATEEAEVLGKPLACAIELMQSAFVILDDLVDGAAERWGEPCWHTLPGVGIHASCDALLVEAAMYQMLRRHFRDHPSYRALLELFSGTFFRAALGQSFDSQVGTTGAVQFDKFDLQTYRAMNKDKIGYYMFYTPTAAALHLAGVSDERTHRDFHSISTDIGLLFTVQDDFDDCFRPEAETCKTNCDIKNGKLTWLVAEAKRRASARQLAILESNYGSAEPAAQAAVLDVYEQLGIRQATLDHLRERRDHIAARIERQRAVPPAVLYYALNCMEHPLVALQQGDRTG